MTLLAAGVVVLTLAATGDSVPLVIEESYDRIKDETMLTVDLGKIATGSRFYLELQLTQFYQGKGRVKPLGDIDLYFYASSQDDWRYLKYRSVFFLAGEERFRFEPKHSGKFDGKYVAEHVHASATPSQIQRMAKGAKLEGAIGSDPFVLTPAQMYALREFATLLANPTLTPGPAPRPGEPPKALVMTNPDVKKFATLSVPDPGLEFCSVVRSVRLFDEVDLFAARGDQVGFLQWMTDKVGRTEVVGVRPGAWVGIVEERKRPQAAANQVVVKIKVLDGSYAGLVGWCSKDALRMTLVGSKPAAKPKDQSKDRDKKADTKLKMAQGLEKAKKPKLALDYYREIIKDYPDSPQAKIAADRVKALEAK
jgi:hypothetical protein